MFVWGGVVCICLKCPCESMSGLCQIFLLNSPFTTRWCFSSVRVTQCLRLQISDISKLLSSEAQSKRLWHVIIIRPFLPDCWLFCNGNIQPVKEYELTSKSRAYMAHKIFSFTMIMCLKPFKVPSRTLPLLMLQVWTLFRQQSFSFFKHLVLKKAILKVENHNPNVATGVIGLLPFYLIYACWEALA